jgi:GNAT superfamily N-acetyltransferase
MSPDLYFIHTRTQDSLGDPVHALSAYPCSPSTPTRGQLVHSDDSDAGHGPYGVLLWADDGVLKLVGVQARWRRKGVATALWNQARELSGLPLDQAPIRTALGEAWFQSLEVDAALEVLNSPMTSREEATGATSSQLALDDADATASRIVELLGKGPEALPYILALCAPTYEDAAEQMRKLQAEQYR